MIGVVKKFTFIFVIAMMLGLTVSPVHAQVPQLPQAFYGSLEINGELAPKGTKVEATGEGVTFGVGNPILTTEVGQYGSADPLGARLIVQGNIDLDTIITFFVNDVSTEQTVVWKGGETVPVTELNLTVAAAPEVTHELTMAVVGQGTVTPASGRYAEGDMTIRATAASGWKFSSWSTGDMSEIANASSAATTLTLDKDKTVTATFTKVTEPPPYYPPTYDYTETSLFGIEESFRISDDGELLETIEATSDDGMLTITIPEGTICLDKGGNPLDTLGVAVNETPPDPPEDAHIIGLAYDFTPDGATFDPALTLIWSYDPEALPEDVAEEDLVVAYYDEDAGEWVEVDSVVDTENNTITASVAHFTTFAIIGSVTPPPVPPAAFSVSSLSVLPAEVEPGEAVTIAVSVANTGGESGSYTAVLKIDGVKEDEERVTVAAGSSKTVTFSVTREEADTYAVTVAGLSDSFTVVPVVAPPEPAAFSVAYLSFSQLEVEPGEAVTITVLIANIGGESGSYTVVLKINGVKEDEETVTIAAGESEDVTFSVSREDPGDYTVDVDGQSGSFTVATPAEEPEPGINWALNGGLIAAVIVVGLGVFFWWRRRAY